MVNFKELNNLALLLIILKKLIIFWLIMGKAGNIKELDKLDIINSILNIADRG